MYIILALAALVVVAAFVAMAMRKPSLPDAPQGPVSHRPPPATPTTKEVATPPPAAPSPPVTTSPAPAETAPKADPEPVESPASAPVVAVDPPSSPLPAAPVRAEDAAPPVSRPAEAPVRESMRPKSDADPVLAYRKGLATTRGGFIARLAALFGRRQELDPSVLEEVQSVLLTADIGPRTADSMLAIVREEAARAGSASADDLWAALRRRALQILGPSPGAVNLPHRPTLILIVGVNGVGKTTTIGKLASRFKEQGRTVVLAAGDTFRAAAVTQLEVWGKRVGCEVVKGRDRADPGSVVFDAVKHATSIGADVVLADTAGRLHTKSNLMEELKKVARTAEKALERPVDEILLVLDATTGQNAIQQAQMFRDAIPVSGIVLTKLDGTAKGGVVLGIADEHKIPVRYVGIGERIEDLRAFDSTTFVEALFAKPDEADPR